MTDERETLGAAEVIQIVSKLEHEDGAFVIGGQATNLWADFYRDRDPELQSAGPFTSKDIDYYGSREVAQRFADAIGGELRLPEMDDVTPNTALVIATVGSRKIIIDFLNSVIGIHARELQKGVSAIVLSDVLDGQEVEIEVKLLHPIMCLKSRIGNILSPVTNRHDDIAFRQLKAAMIVARLYIDEALGDEDRGGWRDARRCFSSLSEYLYSDEFGKKVHSELNIDPLNIIRHFADDPRIDARYRHHQLQGMITRIEGRRKRAARI